METRCSFPNLSTGVEVTTEDVMQAKSKVKQAVNDFVVKSCSSNLTSDYFDPLTKINLKSIKDLSVPITLTEKYPENATSILDLRSMSSPKKCLCW